MTQNRNLGDGNQYIQSYISIFENSPVAYAIANQEGILLKVNKFLCKLLKGSASALQLRAINDFIYPDDIALVEQIKKYLVNQVQNKSYNNQSLGEVSNTAIEIRLVSFEGEIKWAKLNLNILPNIAKGIFEIVYMFQDINDEKRILNELAKSRKFNRQIVDTIPDMVIIYDHINKKYIYHNHAIWSSLGYTYDEWITSLKEIVHKDDLEKVVKSIKGLVDVDDETILTNEYRVRSKEGNWHWLKSRNRIFERRDDGSPQMVMEVIEDITEAKQNEHTLKNLVESVSTPNASSNFFTNLVSSLAQTLQIDCCFIGEINGNFKELKVIAMYKGKEVKENFSLPLEEMPCVSINRKGNEKGYIYANKVLEKYPNVSFLKKLKAESCGLQYLYGKENEVVGLLGIVGSQPIQKPAMVQSLLNVFGARAAYEISLSNKQQALENNFHEIKERKQELEKYINSNLQLENFAYVASHDLREPLRNIVSFSQLLEQRYKNLLGEEGASYIDFVVDSTKHMELLINDLLEYARINNEILKIQKENGNALLQRVLANLGNTIYKQGVQVNYDKESIPPLNISWTQSVQLLQNLLTNAIKFKHTQRNATINITTKIQGNYCQFSIADNGIGIEETYHDQIFVLFKRLHTKVEYQGTGIGLATCKKIVENHGGKIWLESVYGKGTTFHFTLPLAL